MPALIFKNFTGKNHTGLLSVHLELAFQNTTDYLKIMSNFYITEQQEMASFSDKIS